ncbi:hypothetical protein BU17DRAFT_43226 [Hysterangium stoloniferum]|nr:hypothetical protein BU17DRAFT_43226 [Hysterangium stoloniferum]
MPFWKHQTLKPLEGGEVPLVILEDDNCEGGNEGTDEEFNDDLVDTQWGGREGETFEETMNNHINTILQFVEGLRYQVQFRDEQMLQAVEHKGASFLRFARACISKERKKTAGTMWDKSVDSTMFYRTRPSLSDRNTG